MASKQASRSKKPSPSAASKGIGSPSSATTSPLSLNLETSNGAQISPASLAVRSKPQCLFSENAHSDLVRSKENVMVTVRFRPLSAREIRQGEEVAWYADGDTIVRSERNSSTAYAYDRVFGPTTTTRHVYDVAAQHVINGAMEGINGTVFAYGVTSSGKTHTMHGDQRSPGVIPLAVKDVFSIIQETPKREFLLRVSYLEIYNEVINDLLNPAGQNLRIREDAQGAYVENIKEEVVLSPAHALSLIAAGEEHRHVGSTNFNLLSSRSHTIFTLKIESSPCGENVDGEAVHSSKLNLIDLAGSESSRAETTGLRRKEGAYINKSLLTLGTVISKLTEGKVAHVPYRDSKLTRLLQPSLCGLGRVSLICTLTPSSSNSEETHNTLKFAHRAKHIEVQASQNKIIDEKSLIKKYQYEIRCLKEELEQLKRGITVIPSSKNDGDNSFLLNEKLEDGQFNMQSRLEQEEEAKAVLLARIQRLTKLILVSTKTAQSPKFPQRPGPRRRHSFGEEELAYLPYRRRDLMLDEENADGCYSPLESNSESHSDASKERKNRKQGLLHWFKLRKRETGLATLNGTDGDKSSESKSFTEPSTPQAESINCPTESRISSSLVTESTPSSDLLEAIESREAQENEFSGQETTLMNDDISMKNEEASLEKQMTTSDSASQRGTQNRRDSSIESSQLCAELMVQLNEKSFELEVKTADNRVIQDQLNQKICECENLQETVVSLKQQLSSLLASRSPDLIGYSGDNDGRMNCTAELRECNGNNLSKNISDTPLPQVQVSMVEELKQKISELTTAKDQLEVRNQKLAEESSYAKELASAAAVELKALSEEVAKLMSQNDRLTADLAAQKYTPQRRTTIGGRNVKRGGHMKRHERVQEVATADSERDLVAMRREREHSLEAALMEKEQKEAELQKMVGESKQREAYLESELASMWILVAKLKKSNELDHDNAESGRYEKFTLPSAKSL